MSGDEHVQRDADGARELGALNPVPARARRSYLVVAILAPFALVELGLRFVGPHVPTIRPLLFHPKIAHRYDELQTLGELLDTTVLGFQPKAAYADFVLNSKSFRTREYAEEKPPGTFRVLAIGDSFTFSLAMPFELCWTTRLEQELQRRTSSRVEVINLGIPAVGPEFELRLWQIEASRLHADLVVLAFPVGSNFAASAQAKQRRTLSEEVAVWCYGYRFLRNVLRLRAWRAQRRRDPHDTRTLPRNACGVPLSEVDPGFRFEYAWDRPAMSEAAFRDLQCGILSVCSGDGMQESFESSAETLIAFRDEVEASGARLVVLVCPAEIQANPELRRRTLEECRGPGRGIEDAMDAPQRFLRAVFERERIRSLDLLPAFRAATPEHALYGLRDSHWNPRGDALAAERLAEDLTSSPSAGDPWPWKDRFR